MMYSVRPSDINADMLSEPARFYYELFQDGEKWISRSCYKADLLVGGRMDFEPYLKVVGREVMLKCEAVDEMHRVTLRPYILLHLFNPRKFNHAPEFSVDVLRYVLATAFLSVGMMCVGGAVFITLKEPLFNPLLLGAVLWTLFLFGLWLARTRHIFRVWKFERKFPHKDKLA